MEFSVDSLHKLKIALHIVQAVFVFAAWCVEIALFTTVDTTIGKADGWYFGLVSCPDRIRSLDLCLPTRG